METTLTVKKEQSKKNLYYYGYVVRKKSFKEEQSKNILIFKVCRSDCIMLTFILIRRASESIFVRVVLLCVSSNIQRKEVKTCAKF